LLFDCDWITSESPVFNNSKNISISIESLVKWDTLSCVAEVCGDAFHKIYPGPGSPVVPVAFAK
jgi:hypothetical protein